MMTEELEDALKNTLRSAALDAPAPRSDLLDHVERRHRTRSRQRVGAAAAAVLIVIGGGAVAALRTPDPALDIAAPIFRKPVPIERLWPQAVRTLPDRLPNGRKFEPLALLDGGSVLAATRSGGPAVAGAIKTADEEVDELWDYHIATRRARSIAKITYPPEMVSYPGDFTVGDGHVAWSVSTRSRGRTWIEIRAVPLSGGMPRTVTAIDGGSREEAGIFPLIIRDGRVYASLDPFAAGVPLGIYQAPLSGGAATVIPDTEGYQIVDWPWIGSPRDNAGQGKRGQVTFKTLRNVRTGETRTATFDPEDGNWVCGVTWCVGGRPPSGGLPRVFTASPSPGTSKRAPERARSEPLDFLRFKRRDGSAAGKLGTPLVFPGIELLPARDRFLIESGYTRLGPIVRDLKTGASGYAGRISGFTIRNAADRFLAIEQQDGTWRLIDWAAIP